MLDYICDDTFARVLFFLDFKSAILVSRLTSNRVHHRSGAIIARTQIIANDSTENRGNHRTGKVNGVSDSDCPCMRTSMSTSASSVTDESINSSKSDYSFHVFQQLWKEFYRRELFPPPDYYKFDDPRIHATQCQDGNYKDNDEVQLQTEPQPQPQPHVDYVQLYKEKHRLFNNLMQPRKQKKVGSNKKSCFSVPNRCFRFLPIQPSHNMAMVMNEDLNVGIDVDDIDFLPVDFQCTSYILTSLSTGGEYVFLDPFDGSLSIHADIMAHVNTVGSLEDEFKSGLLEDEKEAMNTEEMKPSSTQSQNGKDRESTVLFSVQDYFQLDVNEYFQMRDDRLNVQRRPQRQFVQMGEEDEVVVDWIGIDTHAIIDSQENLVGNIICAARELSIDARLGEIKSCTELLAWKKSSRYGNYGDVKYTCRMVGSPYYMEICPVKEVVYASFSPGGLDPYYDEEEERNRRSENETIGDGANDDTSLDENGYMIGHSNRIYIFPLIKNEGNVNHPNGKKDQYFPGVADKIILSSTVASFVNEPTGDHLIIGCDNGMLELWNCKGALKCCQRIEIATRLQSIMQSQKFATHSESEENEEHSMCMDINNISGCDDSSVDEVHMYSNISPAGDRRMAYASALGHFNDSMQGVHGAVDNGDLENDSFNIRRDVVVEQDESDNIFSLSQCGWNRAIIQIILPQHLPVQRAGFVTLQHHKAEGTTLMLWQYSHNGAFDIVSIVNLPLSTQRKPQVAYDGKRLVVFGQDHIGLIVLVYRVTSTRILDDRRGCDYITNNSFHYSKASEKSGGVVNLYQERIEYVQRIRHAGLGGLEYYDNIFMTLNERFLVLNTKTGNLLDSNGNASTEGLIVIDFEEH